MNLDFNNIIAFTACIFFLFIFGKIFIVPIKTILKLVLNSFLGAFLIYIINLIGAMWGFHIGINIITSIFVGMLGIPGAIVIVIIKFLL
jgi:inhibitor of the pro-sigma K processing machinery